MTGAVKPLTDAILSYIRREASYLIMMASLLFVSGVVVYWGYERGKPARDTYLSAVAYSEGLDVVRDYPKAYELALVAAAAGNRRAAALATDIEERLPPSLMLDIQKAVSASASQK